MSRFITKDNNITAWFETIDTDHQHVYKWNTEWFDTRISEAIEAEFLDFQSDNGITSGDLPPELDMEIAQAWEQLKDAMSQAMAWQFKEVQ